jgi:hypothetical protein
MTVDVSTLATSGNGTSSSPWAGWEPALNKYGTGNAVYFTAGYYSQTVTINVPNGWEIYGDGMLASIIQSNVPGNPGDAFFHVGEQNLPTATQNFMHDFQVYYTGSGTTAAGYRDRGGCYVSLHRVDFEAFPYGVIFDQSEVCTIFECVFDAASPQAHLWLVCGADEWPGADPIFTNSIIVQNSQFNADDGYLVLDDGGAIHHFTGNNFNGGTNAMRIANVGVLTIDNNDFEVQSSTCIVFTGETLSGNFYRVNAAFQIFCNSFSQTKNGGNPVIDLQAAMNGEITSNWFVSLQETTIPATCFVNFPTAAGSPVANITVANNYKEIQGQYPTPSPFILGGAPVLAVNNIEQLGMSYVTTAITITNAAIVITPLSMEGIGIGTPILAFSYDGSNGEVVSASAVTSTTFTATFTLTKSIASPQCWYFYVVGAGASIGAAMRRRAVLPIGP